MGLPCSSSRPLILNMKTAKSEKLNDASTVPRGVTGSPVRKGRLGDTSDLFEGTEPSGGTETQTQVGQS